MDCCLQKLLPSPVSPVSYAENASVLSPIRTEGDRMGLWQPLIPWEHLAFLEAKGGVWARPPPRLGRYPVCFLVWQNTVLGPSWKKKKEEQDGNYDDISWAEAQWLAPGLLESRLKVRLRKLNKRERGYWYIAGTKETEPRGTRKYGGALTDLTQGHFQRSSP